jgi:hypothetical protein
MANDLSVVEEKEEQAAAVTRPRVRGNPVDSIGPTCMFWAMVAGLAILLGIMLIWGISHINMISS